MPRLFGERIRLPQVLAAALLCALLTQCLWFMASFHLSEPEGSLLQAGADQLRHRAIANTPQHSPFVALLGAVMEGARSTQAAGLDGFRWLIRLPFVLMGVMLGGSLWYVARRLYGNKGGYIALLLYVFSPVVVTRSTQILPDIAAAWGVFGLVFTGIAVAHTLYAPREVVLWNWKRIVLMGVSAGIAVSAQYSMALFLVPTLLFVLWLAPVRRAAATGIVVAAGLVGLLVLSVSFVPIPMALFPALKHAQWLEFDPLQFVRGPNWLLLGKFFLDSGAAPLLLLLTALVTYALWPRTRYFGTTAPLLMAVLCVALAFLMPVAGGYTCLVASLPFLYVFTAGVFADLLESRYAATALGLVCGVVISHAALGIVGLVELTKMVR